MTLFSDTSNGIVFIRPHQTVDHLLAQEILERLIVAANEGATSLILDLGMAPYTSAATLKVLLEAAKQFRNQPGRIAIVGASAQSQSLLKISGLLDLISEFSTVDEAQAYLGASEIEQPPKRAMTDDDFDL